MTTTMINVTTITKTKTILNKDVLSIIEDYKTSTELFEQNQKNTKN